MPRSAQAYGDTDSRKAPTCNYVRRRSFGVMIEMEGMRTLKASPLPVKSISRDRLALNGDCLDAGFGGLTSTDNGERACNASQSIFQAHPECVGKPGDDCVGINTVAGRWGASSEKHSYIRGGGGDRQQIAHKPVVSTGQYVRKVLRYFSSPGLLRLNLPVVLLLAAFRR